LVILSALMCFGAALVASSTQASVVVPKWESVTCEKNADLPAPLPEKFGTKEFGYQTQAPKLTTPPEQCNKETVAKWFTQAAGHPNFGITDFKLLTAPSPPASKAGGFPAGFLKEIVVDTPEGLSVNPQALPQCTIALLVIQKCPPASLVGANYLTVAGESPEGAEKKCEKEPLGIPAPGECLQVRVVLPVYNLVPFDGVPSMVGFLTEAGPTFIVGSLDPVDQHVTFTIEVHPPSATSPPIIESRLVFNGKAGNGTYLTMPSNCAGGQTTLLHLLGQGSLFEAPPFEASASFTTAVGASGCAAVPFKPTIDIAPSGGAVDTPEATNVNVGIPFDPTEPIANSYLKTAKVVLPEGMGLNPSSAAGLVACTDAQFGKGTDDPIACPEASRIGTTEVQTPSLPADSLTGTVYVGEPKSNDSSTGEQFRIFIHMGSQRYGVNVRLEGKVFLNPTTGQLTVVVDENPQATFSSFKLHMFGGPRGTLTSPPTCGPNTTTTVMTPWSGHLDANTPESSFTLTTDPSGGSCPTTLAGRKFVPEYTSRSDNAAANAYSPFHVHIGRRDGEQELKVVDATLPRGLSGKIAGIPYCSEAAISAAAGRSGTAELASPSCPSASQIGTTTTAAGSGNPIRVAGKAYLAGPYKGAPLSMVVVTPGVAGPYDVGTVVIRVALNVNPSTTQITASSDVIPNVVDGVKLDIRAIDIDLDRSGFSHNPTNCKSNPVTGTLKGGGSNPASEAAFSSYAFTSQYATTSCEALAFKPKLGVKVLGGKKGTQRRGHPGIQATLTQKESEANTAYTALTLPKTMLLDNSHFKTICTRVQLAAQQCPAAAQYGTATATSPLLSGNLSGPVYLVSSSDKLPNLVADLRGQVNIQLRGVISSVKGAMKTTFPELPDAPVSKFVLKMDGGAKGLIQNSKDLCKSSRKGKLNMKGQNGKQFKNNKYVIKASCGKKK
jgi:hypothetical protein